MTKQPVVFPNRGEIYLVNSYPIVGSEIQKIPTEELIDKVNNTIQIRLGLIAL